MYTGRDEIEVYNPRKHESGKADVRGGKSGVNNPISRAIDVHLRAQVDRKREDAADEDILGRELYTVPADL